MDVRETLAIEVSAVRVDKACELCCNLRGREDRRVRIHVETDEEMRHEREPHDRPCLLRQVQSIGGRFSVPFEY